MRRQWSYLFCIHNLRASYFHLSLPLPLLVRALLHLLGRARRAFLQALPPLPRNPVVVKMTRGGRAVILKKMLVLFEENFKMFLFSFDFKKLVEASNYYKYEIADEKLVLSCERIQCSHTHSYQQFNSGIQRRIETNFQLSQL